MSSERQRVERMLGEANIHFAYREFQQAVAMLLEVVRLARTSCIFFCDDEAQFAPHRLNSIT